VKALHGFEKVSLGPGESQTVGFTLTRRDVSYWDVVSQEWVIPGGEIKILVGFSSRDLPLSGSITLV
jgi:beta-glucosidase